jgi:hypothetical protein
MLAIVVVAAQAIIYYLSPINDGLLAIGQLHGQPDIAVLRSQHS